jgi:DNA-binding MarR family transcriptional regulator
MRMSSIDYMELRKAVQQFIRVFGLLEPNVTPCGFRLSPSQVFALEELEHASLSVTELAEKLRLERSSVSRLVDALVRGGFIERRTNEQNRREVRISLTAKGTKTLEQVRGQSAAFYRSVLGSLSEREQEQIAAGFRTFTAALLAHQQKDLKGEQA